MLRFPGVCLFALLAVRVFGDEWTPEFKLPSDVRPLAESLDLTIDPAHTSFTGRAVLRLQLEQQRDVIWLNGKGLQIDRALIDSRAADAKAYKDEFISVRPRAAFGPGEVTLTVLFRAPISETAKAGPYRRKTNGRWYLFTVFTPIDARRAFPCFDEPRFKIPWTVAITTPRNDEAFANGNLTAKRRDGNAWRYSFATTAALPAEVVSFAVGPFSSLSVGEAGAKHTPVRVITAHGEANEGKAAGAATFAVLPRLEAYTAIPYPWDKLDHIALPEGAFGAVENPGLITYLAKGLLVEPKFDTPQKDQAIRALQAHEIGHQWFGNLVTQADWRDVWLSEGFATWIADKMMDEEQPPARLHLFFFGRRESLMRRDGDKSRPVRIEIASRHDSDDVYDGLVYGKGAAVLMMLEGWLGREAFQTAIRAYLKQHAYGNATMQNLADAIRNSGGTDPTAVMHSFLDESGVPTVRFAVECKEASAVVKLSQERSPVMKTIPLCWRTDQENACAVLSEDEQINLRSCPAFFYANRDGTGYYRTNWSDGELQRLEHGLNQLTEAERLVLLYDITNSKTAARRRILELLKQDPEPEIAQAAAKALTAPPTARP